MKAAQTPEKLEGTQVRSWLRHVDPALRRLQEKEEEEKATSPLLRPGRERTRTDILSECNVLVQLRHIESHPAAKERLEKGTLQMHAWFFEIDSAQLSSYSPADGQFMPIERYVLPPAADVTQLVRRSA